MNPTKTSTWISAAGDLIVLLGLSIVLYFWNLGSLPFYERGEGREGLVVWEMLHSGNWILPSVNGEYIPFKPPLFHWISALTGTVSGQLNEFAIRFPSALTATLGVLMIYAAACRWWNRRAGIVAGLVLGTSFGWWQAATIAQVDMVFTFFVSASLLVFYSAYRSEEHRSAKAIAVAGLLALATLAKGPLGTAIPVFVIVVFLLLKKDLNFLPRLPLFSGSVVYLALAGTWYGLAYGQGGWAFVQRQIIEETLLTGVGDYGRFQLPYYYLPVVFYNLIPWSFFLAAVAIFLYRSRRRLAADNLLFPLVWFLAILLFYSLARGKRGIYMLPLYPAAALLFGGWSLMLGSKAASINAAKWLGWLYVVCCAVVVFGVSYMWRASSTTARHLQVLTAKFELMGIETDLQQISSSVKYSILLFAAVLILLTWSLWTKAWASVFVSLVAISVIQLFFLGRVYYPNFVGPKTFKPFMIRVLQRTDRSTPLVFYHAFDTAVIYYAGRHIPQYDEVARRLQWPYYVLLWEEDFKRLSSANRLKLLDISEGKGPALRHHLVLAEPASAAPLVDGETAAVKSKENE